MRVVSVCSLKGGVGKTSAVLGLASAALAAEIPTLVVDLDPQADATAGLDVTSRRPLDVSDVLRAPRRKVLERAIAPSGWTGEQPGQLDVLLGSDRTSGFDLPSDSRPADRLLGSLATALGKMDDGYQLVLIDCPPSLGALTVLAWAASTRAVVVTEPGRFSVLAAQRALRELDAMRRGHGLAVQPLGILVNRFRGRSTEHRYRVQELRQLFGPLVLTPAVPERAAQQQAQGAARPVHGWPGAGAGELAAAYDAVLDRVRRTRGTRRPPAA